MANKDETFDMIIKVLDDSDCGRLQLCLDGRYVYLFFYLCNSNFNFIIYNYMNINKFNLYKVFGAFYYDNQLTNMVLKSLQI